jgi:hypothetical protein
MSQQLISTPVKGAVLRQLGRGAIGFGSLLSGLALAGPVGPGMLLLVPVGLIALRGCPMCWTAKLIETISAGRMRRECVDGSCSLVRPTEAVARHHEHV